MGDDMPIPVKDGKKTLIQPGTTYLFITRYSAQYNWYTMNSYPTASEIITSEQMSTDRLKTLVENNKRVQALRAAYPNEILLQADVKNNNALNSYSSSKQ